MIRRRCVGAEMMGSCRRRTGHGITCLDGYDSKYVAIHLEHVNSIDAPKDIVMELQWPCCGGLVSFDLLEK